MYLRIGAFIGIVFLMHVLVSANWNRHTINGIFSSLLWTWNIYGFLFYKSLEYFMFIKFSNFCFSLPYACEHLLKHFIQSLSSYIGNIYWKSINLFIHLLYYFLFFSRLCQKWIKQLYIFTSACMLIIINYTHI